MSIVEQVPLDVGREELPETRVDGEEKRAALGQFFTPASVADFMAGLFPPADGPCRLLDAGAGVGALSRAFARRQWQSTPGPRRIELHAFEIDRDLHDELKRSLEDLSSSASPLDVGGFELEIHATDFVLAATDHLSGGLFSPPLPRFTHAILNPPYRKIGRKSEHRRALQKAGIEAVNLYSAFVSLAISLAAPGGQIVAIVPRSFCNGPYYRPFRELVLGRCAIHRIHLFESRTGTFRKDAVLQENVVIRLERDGVQGPVEVSYSTDGNFDDLRVTRHPFEAIVQRGDLEKFIFVPSAEGSAPEPNKAFRHSLHDLGISVSTGPVVAYRSKEHLRKDPGTGTVPLLYPSHFENGRTTWPLPGAKRPNAISRNSDTEKWLYPSGYYCVVRRLSSKEERRRIVASFVDPRTLGATQAVGFENHLNVFHGSKRGLPPEIALGLVVYLNSSRVDQFFRQFSGHTQVNATDLRNMAYPSREALATLGDLASNWEELDSSAIDHHVEALGK